MDDREQFWINHYDSFDNGYNLSVGGNGCKGYKHTEEEIKKMRQIQHPKKVLQLDKDFSIVKEWDSCSHAGKTLGFYILGIKKCCERKDRQKTIGGFFWVYKDDFAKDDFDWSYFDIKKTPPRAVIQLDKDLNVIAHFDSIYQASKETGCRSSEIIRVCQRKRKTSRGYIFRYADTYTEEEKNKDTQIDFKKPKTLPPEKRKTVLQYTMDWQFIREYSSAKEAGGFLNLKPKNIQYCCAGHSHSSGGYRWKYKE